MKFGLEGVQNSAKTVLSAQCGECDIYRNLQKEFNQKKKKNQKRNKINCDSGVSEYFQIKCAFKNACVLAFIFNLMTKFCIHSTMLRIAVFFQWSWGTSLFYLVITLLVAAVYSLSCV